MKRKPALLFIIACFFTLVVENCKKSRNQEIFIGTVIGFDQCSGRPSDSSAQGYVIKIEKIFTGDTIIVDTAMCYNLPKVFVFRPQLFTAYQFSYLFPQGYQNKYKFQFTYSVTPKQDLIHPLCTADILMYPMKKQIIIENFYGTIP